MTARRQEALQAILRKFPPLRALSAGPVGSFLRKMLIAHPTPPSAASFAPPADYETYRLQRIAECESVWPDTREPNLLTFITTVWNTAPEYLEVLAASIDVQSEGGGFDWLILDNGSTSPETRETLQKIATSPYVKLLRVEQNLGIIGGMRFVLERAEGRYVLPLDSDDYLYPKCISIFSEAIRRHDYPALLYSDEDKLEGDQRRDPYSKPDWDPVLFIHSCYIAHLCALDRRLALELDVYGDPAFEGCHDWDTFLRFYRAGHHPRHVPEILYSWRMHPQSTAGNISSKPVVYDSHLALQRKFLVSGGLGDRYDVEKSPLFSGTPDWRLRRLGGSSPLIRTLLLAENPSKPRAEFHSNNYPDFETYVVSAAASLRALCDLACPVAEKNGLIHLLWDQVNVDGGEWPIEAVSLMECFTDTVMVGGRIWSRSFNILAAGAYFGFGRGCDTPDWGRARGDPGYFAQMWKPHSTSAVSSQHCVINASFFVDALNKLDSQGIAASTRYLGAWLGAEARRRGKRVIYSPFLAGLALADWEQGVVDAERAEFVKRNWDLFPEEQLFSPRLALDPAAAYTQAPDERRRAQLDHLWSSAVRQARTKQPVSVKGLGVTA